MRALRPQPLLIKSLLFLPSLVINPPFRLNSSRKFGYTKKLVFIHSFREARATFSTMEGAIAKATATGDELSTEHFIGRWYSVPELRLRDHRFSVPLDYSLDHSTSLKISIFAREVVAEFKSYQLSQARCLQSCDKQLPTLGPEARKVNDSEWVGKEEQPLPYLLYLQGGPGFECPRPTESSGWIGKACEEFRVILMDQRGTGLSTPLTPSSMAQMKSADELVKYLQHFRADNIVRDAEFIRKRIVPDNGPWTILGQSFGGFCAVTYLSFAPQGLKQVLITGGIPSIKSGCTAESVYRACFEQLVHQNEKYYKRFPQDVALVRDVVNYLAESEGGGVLLPSGGILTPRGLQFLGLSALGSSTGFERLHYMLERVWDPVLLPGAQRKMSYYFLNAFDNWLDIDTNPLFALLHEAIYCQGASSRWSAHRIRDEYGNKFDAAKAAKEGRPVLFTGEMIFPWMFDEVHALRPFKEAAELLAKKEDWPSLYDVASLNNNKVPVAAALYYEDLYVNFKLAMDTASEIAGIRLWITNEYMHSGLRDGGGVVLDHLLGMLNGKRPLF